MSRQYIVMNKKGNIIYGVRRLRSDAIKLKKKYKGSKIKYR